MAYSTPWEGDLAADCSVESVRVAAQTLQARTIMVLHEKQREPSTAPYEPRRHRVGLEQALTFVPATGPRTIRLRTVRYIRRGAWHVITTDDDGTGEGDGEMGIWRRGGLTPQTSDGETPLREALCGNILDGSNDPYHLT